MSGGPLQTGDGRFPHDQPLSTPVRKSRHPRFGSDSSVVRSVKVDAKVCLSHLTIGGLVQLDPLDFVGTSPDHKVLAGHLVEMPETISLTIRAANCRDRWTPKRG